MQWEIIGIGEYSHKRNSNVDKVLQEVITLHYLVYIPCLTKTFYKKKKKIYFKKNLIMLVTWN